MFAFRFAGYQYYSVRMLQRRRRACTFLFLSLLMLHPASMISAQEPESSVASPQRFDIAPQSLSSALLQFSSMAQTELGCLRCSGCDAARCLGVPRPDSCQRR